MLNDLPSTRNRAPGRRPRIRRGLVAAGVLLSGLGVAGPAPAANRLASVAPEPGTVTTPHPPAALGSNWKTNFAKRVVPLSEFQAGGPGKDGIPAIDHPRFAAVRSVDFLHSKEPVLELVVGERSRAYPLQILIWHEIVNDTVAGVPVAVTFCPLCNTAIVFDRRTAQGTLSFGVSGNLRNSDLVMFDRTTETWWQQFGGLGLVGDLAGTRLRTLPARIVSWADFRRAHPRGDVLTRETGFERSYGQNPYAGYDDAASPPFFPTKNANDHRLAPKERVVFLQHGGQAAVVPHSALARGRTVTLKLDGVSFVVRARGSVSSPLDTGALADGRAILAVDVLADGKPAAFDEPFWFAVAAFRPDARIIR